MNPIFKRIENVLCLLAVISVIGMTYAPALAKRTPIATKAQKAAVASDAVVREWNEIAFNTTGPQGPLAGSRFMATVQVSVFEAVNAITGKYDPYLGTVVAPPGASAEAAAVMAAHGVLVNYFPLQTAVLDAKRDASLAMIADGQAKTDGMAVGMAAASAMIGDRTNDGSSPPLFHMPTNSDPYEWQTYAGCPAGGGVFKHWPNVMPFAIESSSQFRSKDPPALHTGLYANDFNEVQTVGDVNSTERPQDRTDVARLYNVSVPPPLWNTTLLQILSARNDDITDTARIMALMNMAINDAAISVFESKYWYRAWRPVTAIPRGDEDGNSRTTAGPFTPLIGTPCHPSYPSAHGSLSGAALQVLERAYGRSGHFITVQHPSVPGVVLHYSDLKTIIEDISDARVYGGIHFRFDQDAGERQGHAIGQFVYNHMLRSRTSEEAGGGSGLH